MKLILPQGIAKRWKLLFFLCFSMTAAIFIPQSEASAASLLDKSTINFKETPDGKVYTTRKVWVPNGGYLGVYGQNTNWGIIEHTWLKFSVLRNDGKDVTSQFWKKNPNHGYFLNQGEKVNKRVGPIGNGNYYYIRAECEFRESHSGTGCNGSFTVSSWY